MTIGEFYQRLSQATLEGFEGNVYEGYWQSLEEAFDGLSDDDPVMARLRLCSLINQAVSSPTYLNGFRRAGVARDQAQALLAKATQMAEGLAREAASSQKARRICDSIVSEGARAAAAENIARAYESAGATAPQKSAAHEGAGDGTSAGGAPARETAR